MIIIILAPYFALATDEWQLRVDYNLKSSRIHQSSSCLMRNNYNGPTYALIVRRWQSNISRGARRKIYRRKTWKAQTSDCAQLLTYFHSAFSYPSENCHAKITTMKPVQPSCDSRRVECLKNNCNILFQTIIKKM